jgi:hypothetical protein
MAVDQRCSPFERLRQFASLGVALPFAPEQPQIRPLPIMRKSSLPPHRIGARSRRLSMVAPLAVLALAAACVASRAAKPSAPTGRASLTGVWDLVSVSTRWPDGRVTEPWGASPVGRLTYGADGRMAALLMDARRNQAYGRALPAEVQGSAASYYGTDVRGEAGDAYARLAPRRER